MSDFLLGLEQSPTARQVIKSLSLPIPLPPKLERGQGPWVERPLHDRAVVFGGSADSDLSGTVARILVAAGANPYIAGDEALVEAFDAVGEAFGRPAGRLDLTKLAEGDRGEKRPRPRALVLDATTITEPSGLRALYEFFRPLLRFLEPSGRVVVLGRPAEHQDDPRAAAAQSALEGFVRSLGKEIGREGSTANLIVLDEIARDRLEGPLRFLLSPHSAYVSGQPFRVTSRAVAPEKTPFVRPLEGKVALVTGAARGIGAATAKRMSEEGATVVCLDRPNDDVPLARLAHDVGGRILLLDVTSDNAPARIAGELEELGGVDLVVHNAGITRDKTLAKMSPEAWDQAIEVNLRAAARITDRLLEGPLRDGGRIVCLSSVSGIAGNVGQTNYSASKAGLVGLVRNLAMNLTDRGITVNAVAPGFIETRLTAAIPPAIRLVGRKLNSLSQGGQPVDVAEAITFLATPGASGITGSVVRVCGGALMGA